MSEGLTYKVMTAMPFVKLARIVVTETYCREDRLKAANCLHMRAARAMNGAGWLMVPVNEKAMVREALAFDTTGEQVSA